MQETISLLGGSQTFLGIIATLTILCILHNDGNFITKMLSLVYDRIKKEIGELSKKVKVAQSDSTEWKLLMLFLSNDKQDELHEEGARVMRDINSRIDEKSIEYMGLEVTNKPFLDHVSTCSEHIMAPFYSFFYCLLVFIYDEVLRSGIPGKDWILSSLAIFTFFSFVLWTLVWTHFFRSNSVGYQHIQRPKKICDFLKKCSSFVGELGNIGASGVRIMVCVFFLLLALGVIGFFTGLSEWGAKAVLVMALLLPGLFIGFAKYLAKEGRPEYTHVVIASHIFIAWVVSMVFAFLIHGTVDYFPHLEGCLFEYDSLMLLKFFILFFALMNGIIFPFLFPYISYMALYGDVKRKVALAKEDVAKMHEENNQKLKEFCEKIPCGSD
ncbi:MAG: hypothetical protein KHX53_00580 [Bacteroides sp.]|nr:hypothetical protein [Bacteroides sp.]